MNAKKILAVAVTLCLLLCAMLPMAASAAPGQIAQYLYPTANPSGYYECTYDMATGGTAMILALPADATLHVYGTGMTGATISAYATDTNGDPAEYGLIPSNGGYVAAVNGEATCNAVQDMVRVYNGSASAINIRMNVTANAAGPDGSRDNPYPISTAGMGWNDVPFGDMGAYMLNVPEGETEMVFYKWTATGDGYAYIDAISASDMSGDLGWTYVVMNNTSSAVSNAQYSDQTDDDDYVDFANGDEILFGVATYANGSWACPEGVLSFRMGYDLYGSSSTPYIIEPGMTTYTGIGDKYFKTEANDVAGKLIITTDAEVWDYGYTTQYEKNSDGQVVIDVPAGDSGVVGLNIYYPGAGQVDAEIIYALPGSEYMPIELTVGDHTAPNPWWPGTYYTWTSDMDGLLVLDFGDFDGWLVNANNIPYTSEDGATYAEIEVVAGETAISVVDYNWRWDGKFSVEFEPEVGTLEYPYEVDAVGKLPNTTAPAGETVYYAVNSKLDGTTLTVTGNVVVKVNGNEVDAKNGYTLKAEGATIQVTITNNGNADATYEAEIEPNDNPKTGVSIALPVLAMLMSACGAALIGKKKF